MRVGKLAVMFVFVFCFVSFVSASDYVVINSEDWRDVYSGMHYANFIDASGLFLTGVSTGNSLVSDWDENNSVTVISSRDDFYLLGYADSFKDSGAEVVDLEYGDFNLGLLDELDVSNFVLLDDSYGYSAIAVIPYAVANDAWVIFVNEGNVDEVDFALSSRDVDEVLIYGYVDSVVRDVMEEYDPIIVDNDDKFEDNIEIVEMYLEMKDTKQCLLSNGDFIEKELMLGDYPILFTGASAVPDQIEDYLKESDFEIAVLIGNELTGAATSIRRSTGISVMVKFARSAREQSGGVASVEGLDLFPLPVPLVELEISSVDYNKASRNLEVTYKSLGNVPIYFKGSIDVAGEVVDERVGDEEVVFVGPGNYKTVSYAVDFSSYDNLSASVYTVYGESRRALDEVLSESVDVGITDTVDRCEIEVRGVSYNKQSGEFLVDIKNLVDYDCYVEVVLDSVQVGYDVVNVVSEGDNLVKGGKSMTLAIVQDLSSEDLLANSFVDLVAYYGERNVGLVNVLSGKFELDVDAFTGTTYSIVVALLLCFLSFFLFVWRRKKESNGEFDW